MNLSADTARRIINDEINIYDIISGTEPNILDGEDAVLHDMYNEIAADSGFHPDDDFEEIINEMWEQIAADYAEATDINQSLTS